jgi:hypothetical protein
MYIGVYVKYPSFLSNLNKIRIFSTDFEKSQIQNFLRISPLGVELFHADERTDITKLTVLFISYSYSYIHPIHPNYSQFCDTSLPKIRKANWIGHILCRNCLLKHVVEGKIEGIRLVKEGQRRRRKLLPGDVKKKRGYCKLKEGVLDRTVWRTRFGRGCELVVRQTAG